MSQQEQSDGDKLVKKKKTIIVLFGNSKVKGLSVFLKCLNWIFECFDSCGSTDSRFVIRHMHSDTSTTHSQMCPELLL